METADFHWSARTRNFRRKRPLFRLPSKRQVEGYSTIQRGKRQKRTDQEFDIKRKITFDPTNMNEFSRSKKYRKLGRYSIKKAVYPSVAAIEDRFQGLTNFDTNSGYTRLSQFNETASAARWLPIHVMDLTSFRQAGNSPTVINRLGWIDAATTANFFTNAIVGQGPTGARGTGTTSWTTTQQNGGTIADNPRIFLKWVKLSFNLYGARNRTTTFKLHIVKFPLLNRNLFISTGSNEAKDILQYLERPLIFNNLQTDNTQTQRKMNILKSYTWTIQPQTSQDLNTTTGKIKEAHVFLRMNKCFNLDWVDDGVHEAHAVPAGEQNDGIDYETRTPGAPNYKTGPNYASRIYAILTAFSPVHRTLPAAANAFMTASEAEAAGGAAVGTAIDAAMEPSYDVLIRRGYYTEP